MHKGIPVSPGVVVGVAYRVESAFGAGEPQVLADPGQMEQVITNLAVNGRDAMSSGGCLTIRTLTIDGSHVPRTGPDDGDLLGHLLGPRFEEVL